MSPATVGPGVLIALEGIDGAGKTTQAALLRAWAEARGIEVVATKEPTNGQWGAKIRSSKFTGRMQPEEELQHFLKDREEHVDTLIRPALARGALVVVDRYYFSSVAYQGSRGLEPERVRALNEAIAPQPDAILLLDLEVDEGLRRIHVRGEGQDLFENIPELTEARRIFRSISDPNLVLLDATQPRDALHLQIVSELCARIPRLAGRAT